MTQMGLDYQKHLENQRHNLAGEGIDRDKANVTMRESQFNYSDSGNGIKQREVSAKESDARTNVKNAITRSREADTTAGKLALDKKALGYRYNDKDTGTEQRLANANIANKDVDTKSKQIDVSRYELTKDMSLADALALMMSADTDYETKLAISKVLEAEVDQLSKPVKSAFNAVNPFANFMSGVK